MKNRGNVDIASILDSDASIGVLESQRNFAWKKEEADEFYSDLLEHVDYQDRNLFLGTVVINVSDLDKNKNELIVDGQQRITTINLFLIACRQRTKQIGDERLSRKIQQKIYFTDKVTDEDKKVRFEASPSVNDIFQHIAKYDWDGVFPPKILKTSLKKQIKLILPVYSYFEHKISKLSSFEITDLLRTLYNAQVARIDVSDNSEALGVFERVNARGLGLVISDLLKNELFRTIPDEARESWGTIVDNSYGSTERMLKYFYVSQKGYLQKKDLFRKLKEVARETSTLELLTNLEDFSEFYRILKSGSKEDLRNFLQDKCLTQLAGFQYRYEAMYSSIEALRLFKITQFYPLVYSALIAITKDSYIDSEEAAKKFLNLLALLEKYHFINNMICERIGNEIEKPYAEFASNFYSGDFFEVYDEVVKFMKKTKATESEFIPRFTDTWYTLDAIPQLMYIFDRFSNDGVALENRIKLFNPEQLRKKNHNIEHFYPRNPNQELRDALPQPDNNDNIGNLMAISLRVNSKLQNKSPKDKIDELKGPLSRQIQNHVFVQDFILEFGEQAKKWDDLCIKNRAEIMAKRAYTSIWNI